MDYISSFFCVVDCYLVIECLCFIPLTHSSSDIVDRSFNGKSYLQLLFDFVNESIFDAELGYQEQIYGVGILMIIVQYLYSAIPLTASRLEKVDSVVQPAVEIVQRFVAAKEADITKLMGGGRGGGHQGLLPRAGARLHRSLVASLISSAAR